MHQRGGGVSRFSVENFLSHSTEKLRWGRLRCFRKFRVSQNFMHKKGISLNSVEKFLSHRADKIRGRTLLCFERILLSKIFKQRRGEASRFCRNFFYLTGPKKLRRGTILCFRKFLVGKCILWIRGGGSRFSVEKFLSDCTKKFHWRTLWCFRTILLSKSFMHRRRASRFGRNFLSHRTETKSFVKEPFCFPEKFWYRKKFRDKRGHITIFSRNFYVSQCRKISWASLQCFKKFGVSKKFMHNRGYRVFPAKIFGLAVPKNFVGIPSMFQKTWGIEKFYA